MNDFKKTAFFPIGVSLHKLTNSDRLSYCRSAWSPDRPDGRVLFGYCDVTCVDNTGIPFTHSHLLLYVQKYKTSCQANTQSI